MLVGLGLVTLGAVASTSGQSTIFKDQACLDCHSDQARLTELTTVEVEEVEEDQPEESLSSGPG